MYLPKVLKNPVLDVRDDEHACLASLQPGITDFLTQHFFFFFNGKLSKPIVYQHTEKPHINIYTHNIHIHTYNIYIYT